MRNNNWTFGLGCGLNFSTSPPTEFNSSIDTTEACASISDINGDLLLYTNGVDLWDRNHQIRLTGLQSHRSSTQGVVIVPNPQNNYTYYILTTFGANAQGPPFYHFNGGLLNINTWAFTPLSNLMTLPQTSGHSPSEKLVVTQLPDCKSFLVITMIQKNKPLDAGFGPGSFRVFKINSAGISHFNDYSTFLHSSDGGQLKCSPNGYRIAMANVALPGIYIWDFNRTTNLFSNLNIVRIYNERIYGLEFSPNSQLLYVSSGSGKLYQINLVDFICSPIHDFGQSLGQLQLGDDEKIYINKVAARGAGSSLSVILNPNSYGHSCNVIDNYIILNSKSWAGLPNLIANLCPETNTHSNPHTNPHNNKNPKAIALFVNPKRVEKINNIDVSILCLDNDLFVDGSDSRYETGYFVGLSEFNLYTWNDIRILHSGWVYPLSQAPNNIIITDFLPQGYQLRPNKTYKFRLAVGTPWDSTDIFFKIDCCKSNPILNEEIGQIRKNNLK